MNSSHRRMADIASVCRFAHVAILRRSEDAQSGTRSRRERRGRSLFVPGLWTCLSLLSALAMLGEPAKARELSTSRFANVFVEHQTVRISAAPGEATTVLLRDLDAREVARRDVPADAVDVDFGPLPPGYYEAVAGDTVLPLVVLIDPARRVAGESRLATDNAMSWLVTADQWPEVADVLRLCGIGWVRERLNWGEVERNPREFNWGRYDHTATILHDRGIHVYQVFHSVPNWTRSDQDHAAAPDDLREIHRFAQALATQFRGRVQAWEVWNEPDIFFFSHPSSECAALQKAAFLGFRDVDPEVTVLSPSMAHGAGPFSEGLLDNGIASYFDIWNYHIYADPSTYADRRRGFVQQLARHGLRVPDWITEAGDPQEGPDGVLTSDARRHQAMFLSRAFPQALAAGTDRHFWFVFPFYREGKKGWGLFAPDQRAPFPGLAALSTATYALGHGDYLGTLQLSDPKVHALAFARGDGSAALALWREADEPAEVELPLNTSQIRESCAHTGTPLSLESGAANNSPIRLRLSRAATYLILPQSELDDKLTPPAAQPDITDPAQEEMKSLPGLHDIVVRLRVPGAKADKAMDGYRLDGGIASLEAELYNFGSASFRGDLVLSVPEPWAIAPTTASVSVDAGQRGIVPVKLTVPATKDPASIRLVARAAGQQSAPAVVRLSVELSTLTPKESLPLKLDDPQLWHKNIAGHGDMDIATGEEGGVRFTFRFSSDGDNWVYPRVQFPGNRDFSAYDGLRFEYRTDTDNAGSIRAFVFEPNGAGYISDSTLSGSTKWRSVTVLFSQLGYVSATPADPNGRLDTDHIAGLSVGAHCKPRTVVLEVRNVQAVKF